MTTHLRLNAIYWGLNALFVMGKPEALDRDEVIDFVLSCWDDEAGIQLLCAVQQADSHLSDPAADYGMQEHLAHTPGTMRIYMPP